MSSENGSQTLPNGKALPNGRSAVLDIRGVRKTFPGVVALDGVSLQLRPGEIHALVGENGAGKSTLIKIMTGVYKPDEGQLLLNGSEVHFTSPRDAQRAGISV